VPLVYFLFDVMILAGRDVMKQPLEARQALLEQKLLPKLDEPIRYPGVLNASLPDLIKSVKASGLEGLVAKRRDSIYEVGLRSGPWRKIGINKGQEFVIAATRSEAHPLTP
jgi:bifunctional non-homologous end joining protein LigD